MRSKTGQILFAYWNEVRGGRLAPRRFEIEPSRIAPILSETFILERLDADTYRFRLAGTRIGEDFGTEFRGTNFLDGWMADDRITLIRHLQALTVQGGVGELSFDAHVPSGHQSFECILLPLIHSSESIDRFLGSLSCINSAVQTTERLAARRLKACKVIWPDGQPHSLASNNLQQSPILPHVRNARIVRSDRRQFRVYDGGLKQTGSTDT